MRCIKHILMKRLALMSLLFCTLILFFPSAYAEEAKKDLPPRAITVAPEYPGVVVADL